MTPAIHPLEAVWILVFKLIHFLTPSPSPEERGAPRARSSPSPPHLPSASSPKEKKNECNLFEKDLG